MAVTQLEKELLQQAKGLPKDVLREVIDFIQFLREKQKATSPDNITAERIKLNTTQIEHLEEEFKNYKQIYPNE